MQQPANRKQAMALIAQLQQQFDITDEIHDLRELIQIGEDRHARQITNLTDVIIGNLLQDNELAELRLRCDNMQVGAVPKIKRSLKKGYIVYQLED